MTIRRGEKYVVETLDQLMRRMDIGKRELFETLPEEDQQRILDKFNSLTEDEHGKVTSIEELPDWVFDDWREYLLFKSDRELIETYLEHDDGEYVHLLDGCSVQTVVKLFPPDWR
jgi:hypothetical protein